MSDLAECVSALAEYVPALEECVSALAECVPALAERVSDLAECVPALAECAHDLAECVPGLVERVPGLAERTDVGGHMVGEVLLQNGPLIPAGQLGQVAPGHLSR